MIDFTELPADGVKFEQLIRELLVLDGFDVHWTGVGQDGGRDLVLTEKLKGDLSDHSRKWLVSCKHSANSGKSVGKSETGNITDDCRAIGAEGYLLVCSTQPTSNLITRLAEISASQKIITLFWDSIEIEKRLLKPNTFGLIHTFFPKSAESYQWRIYNASAPSFWAANYRQYFFYMSCRLSNSYPDLRASEAIVSILEAVPVFKGSRYRWDAHYLKLRAVYYDDKFSTHLVFADYLYPKDCPKRKIINPKQLQAQLQKAFSESKFAYMNEPDWDIRYIPESFESDNYEPNHRNYYIPYLKEFQSGLPRKALLHDLVYELEQLKKLNKNRRNLKQ